MNTTSRENAGKSDDMIDKLADQISTLVDIFAKKVFTPAPIKAVEESYVTCGGAHAYYNCPNTDSNQPSVCAATGTYNQVAHQNHASNFMAPPGFAPVQNGQNRTMSSPNHPTSNIEDAFSSNFLDFIRASLDYVPTSSRKTYSSSSNLFGIVPIASPSLSLFHNDPYMKVLQAFYAKESSIPPPNSITPPVILNPSLVLPPSPLFDP
nr:hypothetical protein [Tanacetum cinerariifolium]